MYGQDLDLICHHKGGQYAYAEAADRSERCIFLQNPFTLIEARSNVQQESLYNFLGHPGARVSHRKYLICRVPGHLYATHWLAWIGIASKSDGIQRILDDLAYCDCRVIVERVTS